MIIERYLTAAAGFEARLRAIGEQQWTDPTPCAEWNVRQLVNHVVTGDHLNVILLTDPEAAAEFRQTRDVDRLGDDPVKAFAESSRLCAEAFTAHPDAELAFPRGPITTDRAVDLRATDVLVHTWDLARAIGADETLDAELVAWANDTVEATYAGLMDIPGVFATPDGSVPGTPQERLLHRLGR
ncbi:TIGR03086 family metal-binding protein [Kutzneria sp. NPDC052558]|uniref:TIGR03086 family metal-binding protein n=1 Tax=Kutzneria sp. NPDC052558 TaxID=3364121 RepID=UPI0037CB7707